MSPAALVADTPLALERCELWLFSWAPPDSPQLPSFLQDLAPAVLEARSGQFTAASVHETAGGPPADFGAEYALFLEALQNLFERRGSQAVRMFAYYMFDKIVVQPIQTILKLQRLTHAWIQQHASVTSERLPTSPEAAVSVPTAAAPVSSMEAIFSRARYMDHALHHLDEFESLYESLDNVDAEEAARMAQMVSDSAGSSSAPEMDMDLDLSLNNLGDLGNLGNLGGLGDLGDLTLGAGVTDEDFDFFEKKTSPRTAARQARTAPAPTAATPAPTHVVAFTPKHDPNSPMFAASPGRMHGGPVFAGAGPGSIADNTSPSESPGVSFGSPPFGHPDSGISTHPSPSAAHASAYLVHGHGHVHGGHASPARFGGPSGASPVGAALASNISTPSALAHGNAPSAGTLEAPADAYSAQLWTHLQTSQQHPLTAGAFGDRAMIDALHHPLGEPFEVRASVVQALVSDEADIDGPMALGQIMSPEWLPFRISLDVVFPGSAGVSAPHSPLSTASSPGPPPSPQNVPDQPARLRHRERYGSFGARWNYLPSASTRVSKRSGSTMAMTSAVSHLVRSTLQANTHVFFAGSSLSAESLVSIAMRRGGAAPKAATRTPIPLQDHPSVDRSVQLRFVDTVTVCAAPLAADPALYDFEPAWLFLSSTDSTVPFATLDQTLMDAIGANDDGVARTSDAASLAGPAHRRAAVAAATAAAVTTLTSAGSLLASSALPLLSSRHALAALWPPGAHAGAAVAPVAAAPPGGPGSGTPLAMRAWDLLPSSAPTRRSLSRVFGVLHDIFGDADATIKHADGLVFAQHDRMPSSDSCASSVSNTSLASAAGYLSRGTDLWRGRGVRGPITLFDYYDLQDADQGYTRIGGLQLRKRRRDADPPIEVVPPPNIQFRHDGALMSASVLSFRFWSKLRLEPFGGRKRLGWLAMFAVPIDVGDAIAAGSFSTPGAGTDPMSERARLLSAAVARWMSEFQNEWAANRLGECVPFALRQASTVTVHIPAELAESHESDGAAVRGVISLFVQAFDDTLCTLVTQFLSRAQSESMVFGDEADFVPPSQPNTPSHLTAAQQLMMHHHHHHQQQQQQQRRSSTKPCTHLGLFVFVPPNLFAHGRFGRNPLSGAPFRAHTRGKAAASSAQSAHPTQQCAQVAQSYSPTNPPLRQWTAIRNRLIDIISKRTGFRSDTVRARIAFKAVPFGYLDAVMPPVASARDCHQVYNQCHWVLHSPLASEVVATHVARVSEPARSPAFVIPAPSAILDDPQDSKQVFLDAGGESVELVEKADLERRVAEAGSEGGAGAGAGNATNGATAGSGLGAGQHHTAWQPASERLLTEPDRVLYLFYGAVSVHECKDGDDPSEMRHAVAAAASNASSALGSGSRPQSQQPQQPQAEAHWHGCRRNVMVRWTDHRGEYYGGFRLSAPESRPRASLLAHVLATVHERLGHSGFRFRIVPDLRVQRD
nr:hypothetical protein HK105_007355 [Polyrhizophydium stewartii]